MSDRPIVKVTLTNRVAKIYCDPDVQVALKPFFRYQKPGVQFSHMYTAGAWDGYTNLLSRGSVGTGLFLHQLDTLCKEGFDFDITDARVFPHFKDIDFGESVRHYQRAAVNAMMENANTGGLLIAATGSGKTLTAGEFLRRLSGPAVFVNDELALLDQSRKELMLVTGEEIGIVGRGKFIPGRLTVATIQTMNQHRHDRAFIPWLSSLEAVILDEFHVQMARRNFDVITTAKPKAVYGITATLEMSKPHIWMPSMAIAGPEIFEYPLEQGVNEGYLAEGVVCLVPYVNHTDSRDYGSVIVRDSGRNSLIESLVREGVFRGRRIIVLVERIDHYRLLSKRLADIPHCIVSGEISVENRNDAKFRMESGEIQVILSSRVFAKGQSINALDTIIDATGMRAANNAQQRYGRGTRLSDGKRLVYFDIADRGNYFARAAGDRERALAALKVRIISARGDAQEIYGRVDTPARSQHARRPAQAKLFP